MNSRIILASAGGVIAIVVLIVIMTSMINPAPQNNDQLYTKAGVSPSTQSFPLPVNYTSNQLLDYCSQNETLVYNDVCIRGLWDVSDECKNANFSSANSVCTDPRFGQFEDKVTKEMQDLDNSLTRFVNSCMNATSNDDIQNCSVNIERIKNDCSDPRFYEMMSVCKNSNFEMLSQKNYNGT
ncbi:MAG: hypothetical protein WAN47_07210 [Nitrosotalea sp.]